RIIRGELEPGRRVSETEIAGELSVSRQPVREAFIKLAEEDLIDIRPQRGTFIRKISISMVNEARFVREAIEADVVKLAATTFDAAAVADLQEQIVAQKKCIDGDVNLFISLDDKFHRTLAEGVGKGHAWKVVDGLKAQLDRVRYLSLRQFPIAALVKQHVAIAAAIAGQDPGQAEAVMRVHLNNVVSDLPEIAKANPEQFME
ncbi:MAG: GntR family transcriptional regulator, partial [Rhodobacteraceae bacterium]|nr:GntR family transcriptional regulator [Paracoccaceae bacterium]